MTDTTPAAGTTNVAVFRKNWHRVAATSLSFAVALVVMLGGAQVMSALNLRASSRTPSILPVTREVLHDSIAAVLDDRLSDERLKAPSKRGRPRRWSMRRVRAARSERRRCSGRYWPAPCFPWY